MSKAALLDAIRRLDLGTARHLIAATPDLVHATHRDGRNLLHLACSYSPNELGVPPARQIGLVEWLLGLGFAIDEPFGRDACPALFFAVARARNPRLAAFLLAQGASLDATPGHCLFAAAWWNDVKSLRLLLDAGASIDNVHGITPFLSAWCWSASTPPSTSRCGARMSISRTPKGAPRCGTASRTNTTPRCCGGSSGRAHRRMSPRAMV